MREMPPLPPYSVSDASPRSSTVFGERYGAESPRSEDTEQWKEDELRVADLDEWEEREMMNKADRFYQTGLMGRCLDVWVDAHDWLEVCAKPESWT